MTAYRRCYASCVVAIAMLGTSAVVRADHGPGPTIFVDDFSDGDFADGSPDTWDPIVRLTGTYDASSGDFVFAPPGDVGRRDMSALARDVVLSDVSIRVRIRQFQNTPRPNGRIGVAARGTPR